MSNSAQGVTGLESNRLISDDRLEVTSKNGGIDTGDDEDDQTSGADSDDSDYVPYKVIIIQIKETWIFWLWKMHTLNKMGLAQTTKPHQIGLTPNPEMGANNSAH